MQLKLPKYRPVVLIILDGWGVAPDAAGNAVTQANIPNYNRLLSSFPNTVLLASGEAVGLPYAEPGNSEVGHLNIGAGRIVYQDLPRINMSIADGTFLANSTIIAAIDRARARGSKIHLMGLVGMSGVHSSIEHLYAILWMLREQKFSNVFLHVFTDGRDSPPTAAKTFIPQVDERLKKFGVGQIASVSGRYFAMDRDSHWERTQLAYQAIAAGSSQFTASSALEAVELGYQRGKTDEFIEPTIIMNSQKRPIATVEEGDVIISFNFRADRVRQITKAFIDPFFTDFPVRRFHDLMYMTMTRYDDTFNLPIAFPPEDVKLPLSRVISEAGLSQLHIAETEKYPHVTYFLNGGREQPSPREDRILIPSPKVATYDLEPAMSTAAISETLVKKIKERSHDFIVVNIACPDMVGHTGNLKATIQAVESVDKLFSDVLNEVMAHYGALIITADHGNAEYKLGLHGEPMTSHTTNPVPFIVVSRELMTSSQKKLSRGILADIAPTVLSLLGLNVPSSMTGHNLLAEIT